MIDPLPSKDLLCGHCQIPIHPSDSRRHFGFYVAHGEGRCVQLLQMEIERLQQSLATANANHERFEREWYLRGDEIERLQRELAIWRQCHSAPSVAQINAAVDERLDRVEHELLGYPTWCPRCTQPYERCRCNGTTTGSAQPPGAVRPEEC